MMMAAEIKVRDKINLNTLSSEEKRDLIRKTYSDQSYFQTLFKNDHAEFSCKEYSIAFRNEIERLLLEQNLISDAIPLEKLHEVLSDEMKAYNFNDGVNKISTYFYDTDNSFMNVYHQYIRFIRENIVKEPFWFQKTPTIRIHCPNAINSHHYPRYHSDISYGHPPQEFNIWLPFTDVLDGHSFRTLSLPASRAVLEKYDYDFAAFIHGAINDKNLTRECESLGKAVDIAFGDMLMFDSRAIHSGEPMKTHTRVSMDIRILPLSQYEKMDIEYQGSGRRKILFTPGHCYHLQDSDHFLNCKGN